MLNLMIKLMEAKSLSEVDELVDHNWPILAEHNIVLRMVRTTRKRIKRINAEKERTWKLYEKN